MENKKEKEKKEGLDQVVGTSPVTMQETGTAVFAVPEVQKIAVVIPYLKRAAQGKELLFAMRSWAQNFDAAIHIVVIGDKEDWFGNDVIYIPMEQSSQNPQVNTFEALKLALTSDLVSDRFIWTNDEIYLVNPIGLAHIEVPKTLGYFNPKAYTGIYKENMERTIKFLESRGCLNPLNFSTHTPVLMDKEEVVSLLELYPEITSGEYLFSGIYFAFKDNWHHPQWLDWKHDSWLLPLVSQNPDKEKFSEMIVQKCFLNNSVSGYGKFLETYLTEVFPDKCRFEA